MPFQNVIEFDCGCVGLDTQDGTGNYLILKLCHRHSSSNGSVPTLQWQTMYDCDAFFKPARPDVALNAINSVIRIAAAGRNFLALKALLKD